MKKEITKLFVTWDEYLGMVEELGKKLKGKKFDYIVAIKRGGWIPGVILSHRLNVPVGTYEELFMVVSSSTFVRTMKAKKFLIIDDIADTGKTLKEVTGFMKGVEFQIATLFEKPWTKVKPDYCIKKTRKWVVFPYEMDIYPYEREE